MRIKIAYMKNMVGEKQNVKHIFQSIPMCSILCYPICLMLYTFICLFVLLSIREKKRTQKRKEIKILLFIFRLMLSLSDEKFTLLFSSPSFAPAPLPK